MADFDQFPTRGDDPELHFYEEAAKRDDRYPVAAFCYVAKCLKRLLASSEGKGGNHPHVSGKDICLALKQSFLDDFGTLARGILEQWNLKETNDFGNIIYDLIDVKLLTTSPQDSRSDFVDVYLFKDAFTPKHDGPTTNNAPWTTLWPPQD